MDLVTGLLALEGEQRVTLDDVQDHQYFDEMREGRSVGRLSLGRYGTSCRT